MSDEFDATPYVRPPIIDVPSGVALGIALITAMPKVPPDHVRKAGKALHKATTVLQVAWGKSEAQPAPTNKRSADMRIDNAWGLLLDRVESYAGLPAAKYPKATRARALIDTLSKDREWLKLPYVTEWAESERRLKHIDDTHLAAEFDSLAGPEFLAEVRDAHAAYGVALGVTKPAPESAEVNLADPLRALARAIGRYGLAVAGMVDDDPATLAAVRKALRPLDDYRAGQASRGAGGADETPPTVTPTTPVPPPT